MKNKRNIILISIIIAVIILVLVAILVLAMDNKPKENLLNFENTETIENKTVEENVEIIPEEVDNEVLGKISQTGEISSARAIYTDKNGQQAVIPAGFAVINDSPAIEDGLIISDNKDDDMNNSKQGNQFVWIPVENPVLDVSKLTTETSINEAIQTSVDNKRYPMAIRLSDGNYASVLYRFEAIRENTVIKVIPYTYETSTIEKEPKNLDATLDNKQNIKDWTSESYQLEFNEIVKKVKKDKGFWIGRFEMSQNNGNVQSKTMQMPLSGISWYDLYSQAKTFKVSTTSGHMIWGCQWDQIMLWIKDIRNGYSNNNFAILDSTGLGNYLDTKLVDESGKVIKREGQSVRYRTGETTGITIKNIYDLAGNIFEWTMEANYTSLRTARGGYCAYNGSTYTLSSRFGFKPDYNGEQIGNIGTRLTIY